jgi:hypothetical protein
LATTNWTGSNSTNWFDAGNWDNGIPGTSDDVVIGTTVNSPVLNAGTTVNSLIINGTDTLTLGDVNSGNSVNLDATLDGIVISGGGTITGQGNIIGDITATGTATVGVSRVNAQNTPQLLISGTIIDTGGDLTLTIADDAAELILTGTSGAHAVSFGGTTGQLTIFNVTLTVATQMAIGSGSVFLSAATLVDTNGVTIVTGTILGTGLLDANVTATGAASIAAAFGTLQVHGTITDSGGALVLSLTDPGDRLIIDGASAANAMIFNGGTLELNTSATLTLGTQMAIGSGALVLDGGGATLTDGSGVTISGGTISGSGILVAEVTASGLADITATGGTLDFTAGFTDSDDTLSLTISANDATLVIEGTSTANSLSFNGASGTLFLATVVGTGTLSLTNGLDVGSGTVQLGGAGTTLTAPALTISTGTITGAGLVQGTIDASGAANITANGGTLEIQNQLTDNGGTLTLTISGSADRLLLDFNSTANAVSFNGNSGTLELNSNGTFGLTVATQMAIGSGTVKLDSAFSILTDTSGITLAGGTIIGLGKVDANLTGTGTVRASGGTLELVTAIGNSAGPTFEIANGASNVLQLDGTVGTGNTFAFLGAAGELGLGNDAGFNATVSGLNIGTSTITPTTFVHIEGHAVTAVATTDTATTGTITLSDGAVLHLTNLTSPVWFVNWISDGGSGTEVFLSDAACYCRGTLILGDRGEVPVEELAIGDRVVTMSGEARPIRWIGRRAYDARFVAGNRGILPIRIDAGAIADGVPARDLLISPEHALILNGLFLPARLLINGVTIRQAEHVDRLEYFHIELDTHDIIFAERATAETFTDFGGRGMFHNNAEFAVLYPDAEPADWDAYAALLDQGAAGLPAIRAALLARAEGLGRLSCDPDLHLIVDGAVVRAQSISEQAHRFELPAGAGSVAIASRSVVPSETAADSLDPRRLGVPLEWAVLSRGGLRIEVGPECPALVNGFHQDEGSHRWTDGRGSLPPELIACFSGEFIIDVQVGQIELHYPADAPAGTADVKTAPIRATALHRGSA